MPLVETSRATLESLLRARRLDRTLTTALAPLDPHDEYAVGATGITALDAIVGGGFPRGQLSEIAGARSSGCASLIVRMIAAASERGELVALVDALDMFDVASADAAGVDLDRLLWIRGHVVSHPGFCRDLNQRAMEQAIRALALVLSAGNFGLVVLDAGEASADALKRLPFTTWLRLQRLIEGRQTICVLVASEPVARSAAGLTVRLGRVGQVSQVGSACGPREHSESAPAANVDDDRRSAQSSGGGAPRALKNDGQAGRVGSRFDSRLFDGLDVEARVIRARSHAREEASVGMSTLAYRHD